MTDLENGQYVWAAANFGLMVGEQVLYVLTLGESGLGKQAGQCALSTGKTVWKVGGHKSATKWANQMARRGWTEKQITEAIQAGQRFPAQNMVNPANSASRYVHPQTGQSVVIDDVTKELLRVGGKGFKY